MTELSVDSRTVRRTLLRWYRQTHRRLPWRAEPLAAGRRLAESRPDPYHVLVSETMLQQTQVATVIDFFNRFVSRFPTVVALAEADEQQVLRAWQGLGYYRRARLLHRAARTIVSEHGGRIPDDARTLRSLPGIGRYTAGAIASIAFGRREAAVDGNVSRVLARWTTLDDPIDQSAGRDRLWTLAESLVAPSRPGDFNQALMELGAVVCLAKNPDCAACPARSWCRAAREGDPLQWPVKSARVRPRPVRHTILAIRRGRNFLFQKRPDSGLWAGMWQLPTLETDLEPETERDAELDADKLAARASERLGLAVKPESPRADEAFEFVHQTTHRTITFAVRRLRAAGSAARSDRGERAFETVESLWRPLDALDDLPLANPQRRAVRRLREGPA